MRGRLTTSKADTRERGGECQRARLRVRTIDTVPPHSSCCDPTGRRLWAPTRDTSAQTRDTSAYRPTPVNERKLGSISGALHIKIFLAQVPLFTSSAARAELKRGHQVPPDFGGASL